MLAACGAFARVACMASRGRRFARSLFRIFDGGGGGISPRAALFRSRCRPRHRGPDHRAPHHCAPRMLIGSPRPPCRFRAPTAACTMTCATEYRTTEHRTSVRRACASGHHVVLAVATLRAPSPCLCRALLSAHRAPHPRHSPHVKYTRTTTGRVPNGRDAPPTQMHVCIILASGTRSHYATRPQAHPVQSTLHPARSSRAHWAWA